MSRLIVAQWVCISSRSEWGLDAMGVCFDSEKWGGEREGRKRARDFVDLTTLQKLHGCLH